MGGFDADELIADIASSPTPEKRFNALTGALAGLGLDIVNYGFFDLRAAALMEADIQFLTTMTEGWMDYYFDRNLPETDFHVGRVLAGKITPYTWGEAKMHRLESADERTTALEAAEAGLRSSLCVPLASPLDPFSPVAGITLGSSLPEHEFRKVLAEHGATLATVAHVFHNASIRQVWSERAGRKALSVRERDCLQFLADGRRQDAIAHAMGLAKVTVELYLRGARKKLGARTLNEAIAKGLVLGDIRRG